MEKHDIKAYLNMDLLRFTTAGSVDDGKSTLIGRLLYDSKSIFEDQYEAIKSTSQKRGEEYVNLALLTDGLRAEREQGITIDVAYRYFATPKRKFIIADTPGHIQYTRNMVTGASTANLAIVLVDARQGIVEQTRRHSYIASLLRIPHLILAVNKMDLVKFQREAYESIVDIYTDSILPNLSFRSVTFIPISALMGDNVVERSKLTPWYKGPTLLEHLESVELGETVEGSNARFPVQYVIRPMSHEYHDYRGYAGRVSGGVFRKGDRVKVLPSGQESVIKSIDRKEGGLAEAFTNMSVTITLQDDVDISRGDVIVKAEDEQPALLQEFEATICWLNEQPFSPSKKYAIKHATKDARCVIKEVIHKVDISNLGVIAGEDEIRMNDIARVLLKTTYPLPVDSYGNNRITGSFILIDETSNNTVAAGMIAG